MTSATHLTARLYQGEADYWRIRAFLRQVYPANAGRQRSWDVVRFDYWRWHGIENIWHLPLEQLVTVWEDEAGEIRAVLTPESRGEAFLHIQPALRSPELADEMLDAAIQRLAAPDPEGRQRLQVWANEHEELQAQALGRGGFTQTADAETQRRRSLDEPIPDCVPAVGYIIRSLGEVAELPARSWLSWLAFHPHEPAERYQGWEWYFNIQRCPLYRRDLDLVAVREADGELAAFCTVWFDDANRMGVFEPVGTAPAHQRRGLGTAVMAEGLRRLKRLGARTAHVSS